MPVPGRNAPCPCESGKRYKKCHGAPNSPDPFLGVTDDIVAVNTDHRWGRTQAFSAQPIFDRIQRHSGPDTADFDQAYSEDLAELANELARSTALLAMGKQLNRKGRDAKPIARLAAILDTSIDNLFASLLLARYRFPLQSGIVLRSALECIAVIIAAISSPKFGNAFRAGTLNPTKAVTQAAHHLRVLGEFYGILSQHNTHVGPAHEKVTDNAPSAEPTRNALRLVKATAILLAVATELLFPSAPNNPRFWRRLRSRALQFAPDPDELEAYLDFPRLKSCDPPPTKSSKP